MRSFAAFSELTQQRHFEAAPSDWVVVITDVKGSTQAIESGRYKDVNMVGAAAIAAVQNSIPQSEFPYVFGGDGASFLIHRDCIDTVVNELGSLKALSELQFKLSLRVGIVGIDELVREGAVVEVAKYELCHGKCVAIFRGGGLTVAEKKVKQAPEIYEIADASEHEVNLDGLSCRWNDIPNRHGCILSLLVAVRQGEPSEVYDSVLRQLNVVFHGDLPAANPVNEPMMRYQTISECIRLERRYHRSAFSFRCLSRCVGIVAAVLIFKFKLPPLVFDPMKYRRSVAAHSDYQKFDDMLRMILDCSDTQVRAIAEYLENLHREGVIYYGLYESATALMTCYVNDIHEGNHIHFIDGGDGGYAMAAKQLKAQMRADS